MAFRFNGHVAFLEAGPAGDAGRRPIRVTSDGAFTLQVSWQGRAHRFDVAYGDNAFEA